MIFPLAAALSFISHLGVGGSVAKGIMEQRFALQSSENQWWTGAVGDLAIEQSIYMINCALLLLERNWAQIHCINYIDLQSIDCNSHMTVWVALTMVHIP